MEYDKYFNFLVYVSIGILFVYEMVSMNTKIMLTTGKPLCNRYYIIVGNLSSYNKK